MGVKLASASAGSVEIVAPATASNYTATMPEGSGTVVINGVNNITSGTAQGSTSGTAIDFVNIPSWVKRITVMFNGVSTNGTNNSRVQIGDAGGIETSGYAGTNTTLLGTGPNTSNFTAGFDFFESGSAASVRNGILILCNVSGNIWSASGQLGLSDAARFTSLAGVKTISDTLTQIRITTVGGTDTFDAGSINILYE
jgi:hypothetical protein